MILKTRTYDRSDSGCWNFYDNIETARYYYDEEKGSFCVAAIFKGNVSEMIIPITEPSYLCNDRGQTIEKLYPQV